MPGDLRFKDHFSERSDQYARYRPTYPAELFAAVVEHCNSRERAWDCATGNGQAALALSEYFDKVIATDASDAQIGAAPEHAGIEFRVAPAEASGLASRSVDLITVGQALHWFDIDAFGVEARRVAAPGGVLAVWCYEICEVSPICDEIIDELYSGILEGFWPPERQLIERRYAGVVLPGTPLPAPELAMQARWMVGDMLGYLRTWSACKRYRKERGDDPVAHIERRLADAWGDVRRTVRWPLNLMISRL